MPELQNIIFDFGGVLLDIYPERSMGAFRRLLGGDGAVSLQPWISPLVHAYEAGELSESDFFSQLSGYADPPVPLNELIDAWNLMLGEIPQQRIEVLRAAGQHYHTFLLSNSNTTHFAYYDAAVRRSFTPEGLESLFHGTVFSYREGCLKPAPEIYRILIERYGLNASECVFIDDREENAEGAIQVGMKSIWLKEGMELASLFTAEGRLKEK